MRPIVRFVALSLFLLTNDWSLVPDRAGVERKLRENRYFLEFINCGVSNFKEEKSKQLLREAAILHYRGYRAYLQGHYEVAHDFIRQSQHVLRDLYVHIYDTVYRRDALHLLQSNSVVVVSSRDERAIRLLNLGYRDVKHGDVFRHKAYHHPEHLYSVKIYLYIDALKYLRQAKRYAFLALIETATPYEDKQDFKKQTAEEYFSKPEVDLQADYVRVRNLLTNMIKRRLFANTYDYFTHHSDNYGFLAEDAENLLEKYLLEAGASKEEIKSLNQTLPK